LQTPTILSFTKDVPTLWRTNNPAKSFQNGYCPFQRQRRLPQSAAVTVKAAASLCSARNCASNLVACLYIQEASSFRQAGLQAPHGLAPYSLIKVTGFVSSGYIGGHHCAANRMSQNSIRKAG
jgi:hypothetical protein